jgi:membrane protease YdiL (CAAX protease family)
MELVLRSIGLGMLILLAGTIPRNIFYTANLRVFQIMPWAAIVTAVYLWFFWRYLRGDGPPVETREFRRRSLRARAFPARQWLWAMMTGVLGIIALVFALRIANRMVMLPVEELPDLSQVPRATLFVLQIASAAFAGIIEESAFRGYMQKPLEEHYGLAIAILITGTMFALAHLSFTWILWPYYMAVATIYGSVAYLTKSILPAIALHTLGNLYSNFDLLLHGRTDWQTGPAGAPLIWESGTDAAFWETLALCGVVTGATVLSARKLANVARG